MHTKIAHAVIAAVLTLASGLSQAADIYPVDKARFMTNTRFDFKVELDSVVERKDISIEINGKDYRRVLKGDEIYIGQEIDAGKSAVLMRNVEIITIVICQIISTIRALDNLIELLHGFIVERTEVEQMLGNGIRL